MSEKTLWNLYGKRYDLTNFLDKHPGGRRILELSKSNKDLTPLFESYHSMSNLNNIKKMLDKYYVDDQGAETTYKFDNDGFYYTLKKRILNYFDNDKTKIKVNWFWYFKTIIMNILFILFFGLAFYFSNNLLVRCTSAFLSGIIIVMIGFCMMHDSSHYALFFRKPILNETICNIVNSLYMWNSDLWLVHHTINHHAYTGDPKRDPDLLYTQPIVRKSINIPKNKYLQVSNRFLPYITYFFLFVFPGFYFGSSLMYWLNWKRRGYLWRLELPKNLSFNLFSNILSFCLSSFILYSYFYNFNIFVWLSFIVAANTSYGMCILPDHDTFETTQNHGDLGLDWGEVQVRNSGNFENGRCGDLFCHLFGGINYQIEHHLFPSICHVHYPGISKIVKETCQEFNIPYVHHPTLNGALKDFTKSILKLNKEKEKEN